MPPAVAAAGIGTGGALLGKLLGDKAQSSAQQQNLQAVQQFQNATQQRLNSSQPNLANWGTLMSQANPMDVPGGGINVNTARFENPNWQNAQQYADFQKTPQYQQALSNVTGLAQMLQGGGAGLYNVGAPAYQQSLKYYQDILGGSQAAAQRAIAPQVGAISQQGEGAAKALEASGLRGGALDTARANLAQQTAGNLSNLIPQAQQNAAQAAGSLGLQGTQQGMGALGSAGGLQQGVAGMEQNRMQTAAQQELANRQLGANAYLQGQGLNLQQLLGLTGLGVNERLGLGQLGVEQGNQALQGWLGSNQIIAGQGNQGLLSQQMANNQAANAGQAWGGLFGQLGNTAANAYGNWYNNRNAPATPMTIPQGQSLNYYTSKP